MYKPSRRKSKKKMPKYLKYGVIFFLLYCLVSFAGSIFDLYKLNCQKDDLKVQLAKLQAKNLQLKEKIKLVKSDSYVERVAREELGLVKKDETLIITTGSAKKAGVWKVNTDSSATKKVTD